MTLIPFARKDVPLLGTFDAVVAGGSFGGVAAAEALAHSGWRVALVEPRTYLGREQAATLRPWLEAGRSKGPGLLRDFLALEGVPVAELEATPGTGSREIPISLNHLKRFLEDRLLNVGVQLFYASLPVGLVTTADNAVSGLVIGNKSGRQLLRCHTLIDATETSLLTRLAQQEVPDPEANAIAIRTLEFDQVGTLSTTVLPVPEELGLVNDRVILHQGYRGQGHLLVECWLRPGQGGPKTGLDEDDITTIGRSVRDLAARRQTTRVAAYLMQNVPQFAGATFAAASHELWYEPKGGARCAPAEESTVARLWSLDPICPPSQAVTAGQWLANHLLAQPAPSLPPLQPTANGSGKRFPGNAPVIYEPATPQRGKVLARANGTPSALPVVRETDVLVVGGGTSGATAAITAACEGVTTALVEMNPGLGGTGTYGGVHSYWFGRRVGFAADVTQMAVDLHHELRQPPPQGAVPRWNIEAKVQALIQAAEDAGVELYLNAIVIGTVVEVVDDQRRVRGVALATRQGPIVLLARVVIDATGDADVAAQAGAGVVYGAQRDHVTMWYSLAQFARPGRTRNNFTSMVDVGNVRDYTRAILAGRRRLRARDHDHGIYVAPRESRHVQGEVVLTLSDQLLQRCWPDVINIAFSNHDVKGHSSSDWVRIGLIPPNLEVEIPYRALLPGGLHNILVVGKALSATHDALPAIRMQADMENLGGAAALAAAYAVQQACDLRAVDVRAVQERLVEAGVLPRRILERRLEPWRLEGEALQRTIAGLGSQPLYTYSDMDMEEVFDDRLPPVDVCCAGPHAVQALEEALSHSGGQRRLLLARLLGLLQSPTAIEPIVDHLHAQFSGHEGTGLPARSSHIRYAGAPPDQGAMPDEVYLLHALALLADKRALPIWQRVVDLLADATAGDVESGVKGVFYYVEAVCAGAERLGNPAAIPLLQQLHSYEPFHGLTQFGFGVQEDHFLERRAYLELLIARALARCGSAQGAAILIDYLQDARALLAEHAHSELVAISGQDLGKETAPWSHWLEAQDEQLPPVPYQRVGEPRQIWDAVAAGEILVDPELHKHVAEQPAREVTNDYAA